MRPKIYPPATISFKGILGEFYIKGDVDTLIDDLEYEIRGLKIDKILFGSIMEDFKKLSRHLEAIEYSLELQEKRKCT